LIIVPFFILHFYQALSYALIVAYREASAT
jgi:hypothetical protein